ncbi:hypothetical protein ACR3I8_02890 [Priestia flexa]
MKYLSMWTFLIIYAWLLAPGSKGKNDLIMIKLISGQFTTVEPLVVMIFHV